MIPNPAWFPTNMAARVLWFANFKKQFAELATDLGFSAADVTSVTNDNSVMQFLGETTVEMKNFDDAVRKYRIIITEHKVGDPMPDFPAVPVMTLPVEIPTGLFERLSDLVDRIRLAASFTQEIGAMLGINPVQPTPPDPNTVKPTIKATPLFESYKFDAFVMRMGMDSFKVQIRRMESETWTDAGFGTSSPLEITVQPTTPGQPERLQVRAILIKKNEPVGQPSDPVYVTVNP